MITVSIDVSKIDETRFKPGKNGKGPYLEIVLFEVQNDKFGNDFSVKQSLSKEERANKVQLPFIGSGKDWSKGSSQPEQRQQTPARKKWGKPADPLEEDSIPY